MNFIWNSSVEEKKNYRVKNIWKISNSNNGWVLVHGLTKPRIWNKTESI